MKPLFDAFLPADANNWKARLEKDLKGITFEQLSVTDNNGILVHPFYTPENINQPKAPLFAQPDWIICEQIKVTDTKAANAQALDALNHGVAGLYFLIENQVNIDELLNDIELSYIYCYFQLNEESCALGKDIAHYLSKNAITTDTVFIGYNPLLKSGNIEWNKEKYLNFVADTLNLNNCCIDGSLLHNAGSNSTYQLAATLAIANEYLHCRAENGSLQHLQKLHVTLTTDTLFYEQIAKLRACRKLLLNLCAAYNISPQIHLHTTTGNIYRSSVDSYTNLLRDTIAGMAAALGGSNSISILPFDAQSTANNSLSLRMSRNQQLIFKEESYLNKVADVGAGSYYIETLTDQIGEKAWTQFQQLESNGGYWQSYNDGTLLKAIHEQAALLIQEYREGKRVLIGVNKFTNPTDLPTPTSTKTVPQQGIQPVNLAEVIL